jgi:hypothetical protein
MTRIVGTITDSAGSPLTGQLTVTQGALTGHDGTIITTKPSVFSITSGAVDIEVHETQTHATTCRFVFETVVGETRTTWLDLTAVVPDTAEIVALSSLTATAATSDSLDTTVRRLAQLILSDPEFLSTLRSSFVGRGEWNADTYYVPNDVVTVSGNSYVNLDGINKNKNPETTPASWQLLAQRGETGAGTTGFDLAYGAGWQNSTLAPTMGALYNKVETLATTAALGEKAPIISPVFTGTPQTSDPPSNVDYGTRVPTTKWVWDILEGSSLLSRAAPTTPSAPTPPVTDASGKQATTQFVRNYLYTVNPWGNARATVVMTDTGKRLVTVSGTVAKTESWNPANNYVYVLDVVLSGNFTFLGGNFTVNVPSQHSRGVEFAAWPVQFESNSALYYYVKRTATNTLTIELVIYFNYSFIEV